MRGIINNIITFYVIQAEALSILVANTQKALKESDGKRRANEQAERIENFVKVLATDLNNMITKIYFLKEHKHITDEQATTLVNFVKASTKISQSLLAHFQKVNGQTFEKKLDREIEEIEAHIRHRLKEYDEALGDRGKTLKYRMSTYVSNKVTNVKKSIGRKSFGLKKTEKAKLNSLPPHMLEHTPNDSIDSCHTQLESFINELSRNMGSHSSKKSERQIHLRV